MNIKKILLILIIIVGLSGCTEINNMNYGEVLNTLQIKPKKTNTFRKGFQFYTPKGLQKVDASNNYVIFSSGNREDVFYYLYVDLVSYSKKKELDYQKNTKAIYSENISYDNKLGYVEINLWENNKYLIEIMYNYAKIEVMVDEAFINKALINSINILKSIKYNDEIIDGMLKDDNFNYTEEVFDMFKDITNDNLEPSNDMESTTIYDEIKDTDFLN